MINVANALGNRRHGNLQKHLNSNPLQRWLLGRFHRQIIALIKSTEAYYILDAGCGEGFTMLELEQKKVTASLMGIDFSPAALVWYQTRQMGQAPVSLADVHHLPFPDNSFDLVYCLEVLEHLPDSIVGLRELRRVSRDYVLVSVPHEPFFRTANFLRGKHVQALGNDPEHLHNYSGRAFQELISDQLDLIWHGHSFPWQIALARK